ncbi:MAG: Glutathione reductase [Vezdaea aestivalis]|nr:MAG: Glutathione reductase [Vezdaea aestivalis]
MAPITKQCDYLVIGGGSGGLASGRRASGWYGAKTIAIESNKLGGTCVNVGCVPKKVTWNAATIAQTIHQSASYGFSVKETAPFDWAAFKAKRDAYISRLNDIYARNLDNDKVETLHGVATLTSPTTADVKLDDGTITTVEAKHVLIATGGYPNIPSDESIPGASLGITSDGFFELATQPKKVAIVGAGYIAVELAGMFHALGTETHLFIRQDSFLRTFDPMIQESIVKEYERQGIVIHRQSAITKVSKASKGGSWLDIEYKDSATSTGTLDADCLLWAIGRKPSTQEMNLDKLGIKTGPRGHIVVDDFQNTNVPGVYALGDVCGRVELTPVAIAAGRRLAERLFGGKVDAKLDYNNVPSVVFAHPEVGSIGLTEPQAREKFGDDKIKVYKAGFTAMYYAVMEQEQKGPTSYKIICAGEDEKVIGLHILGEGSAEMLQGFGVAIKMGATKKDFDSCVAIHPTSAEELVTMR